MWCLICWYVRGTYQPYGEMNNMDPLLQGAQIITHAWKKNWWKKKFYYTKKISWVSNSEETVECWAAQGFPIEGITFYQPIIRYHLRPNTDWGTHVPVCKCNLLLSKIINFAHHNSLNRCVIWSLKMLRRLLNILWKTQKKIKNLSFIGILNYNWYHPVHFIFWWLHCLKLVYPTM